jgi:N-acetylglucosaminyldiphosphoundecaprenol N-acetyl-beta-D-mannosaminyltransferase
MSARAATVPAAVRVLDVHLHDLSRAELLARLEAGVLVTPNVDIVMRAARDAGFRALLADTDYRVCDSQIVLAAARFLGTPLREKISGSDLLADFCRHHRRDPAVRVFLLGAGPGVAEAARRRINAREGREVVVGAHGPSYGFDADPAECAAIVARIRQAGATVLAVGVGSPRQERWIMAHRAALPEVKLFMALGATLDFEAGRLQRAPPWMRRAGLEWAARLWQEPRRLWRRYLVDDLPFFWELLRQRLGAR